MHTWLCALQHLVSRSRTSRPAGYRPEVEPLEARQLLSTTPNVADERWVGQVYEDVLRRTVDASSRNHWNYVLDQGYSRTVVGVVVGLSAEAQARAVDDIYRDYLQRQPDAGGRANFEAFLNNGGTRTIARAAVLGAEEYYQRRGASDDGTFLNALYQDVLGRAPTTAEREFYGPLLRRGTSRVAVAAVLLESEPARARLVEHLYEDLLHRQADTGAVQFWVGVLGRGAREEHVAGFILGSPEYTQRLEHDPVLDWTSLALQAVRAEQTAAPAAARHLAMVSLAVHDAVNAVNPIHGSYLSQTVAPSAAYADAAAAAAAHGVLLSLYPDQEEVFDEALERSLDRIPDGASEDAGVRVGEAAAQNIVRARATDRAASASASSQLRESNDAAWRPTPPANQAAELPGWGQVVPFGITSPDDFGPAGPPAIDSIAYANGLSLSWRLGHIDSRFRTADQTQIARFWADGAGTSTPAGHWNQIAAEVARQQGTTLAENARLFALLNMALADAAIVAWDTKYETNFWRPITAIRTASEDANGFTVGDSTWTPLLVTPPSPSYISEHSAMAGAAGTVLASVFGASTSFTARSDSLPGVTRSYTSFAAAADEAGASRVYAGVQFNFDNGDGLTAGRAVGSFIVGHFLE